MLRAKVAILGAGISGLTVAWKLQRVLGSGEGLVLIDKSHRVGGSIQTLRDGVFLFEQGPRGCRPKGRVGAATLELVEALGLQQEVISGKEGAKRFLWYGGRLHAVSQHPLRLLLSPLGWSCWREYWRPKGNGEEESIEAFFTRRFGKLVAERYADPLVSGIWAGDMRRLSIQACFPRLVEWEQGYGSVVRGALFGREFRRPLSPFMAKMQRHSLFSFRRGMESLTDTLAAQFKGKLLLTQEVEQLSFNSNGVQLFLRGGTSIEAEWLILAIPAHALLKLLPSLTPLGKMASASLVVINCGYSRRVLKRVGFGYLVPANQGEQILGAVWDSAIFPMQNRQHEETRLTVMMGGARHPEVATYSPQACLELAMEALYRHLEIRLLPDAWSYKLARSAIPQYFLGHLREVRVLEQALRALSPRVALLGNSFYGASVNECILQADLLAKKLGQLYSEGESVEKEINQHVR